MDNEERHVEKVWFVWMYMWWDFQLGRLDILQILHTDVGLRDLLVRVEMLGSIH